jgi:tRNA-Thr(GGU) m(6)t(6)A37 methyltransferase TsaA
MTASSETSESGWTVQAVGVVSSTRDEMVDDDWDGVTASITLTDAFGPEAIRGLDEFSHVEVVFLFDRVAPDEVHTGARRPRGNPDWPEVGVFAQRVKNRPNRIGLSTCEVLGIEDRTIRVRGLDAIEGTPVLDLKPFMVEFGPRGPVHQPAWSHELMAGYF